MPAEYWTRAAENLFQVLNWCHDSYDKAIFFVAILACQAQQLPLSNIAIFWHARLKWEIQNFTGKYEVIESTLSSEHLFE